MRTIALLLLLLVGCAQQHDVPITIAGLDRGQPAGFQCRAPTAMGNGQLLTDLVTPSLAHCSEHCDVGVCLTQAYVFDFVTVGGVPSCRASALTDWCETPGRCRVAQRRCFDVDSCVGGGNTAATAQSVEAGLRAASGGVINADPPGGTVMVRVIGSGQSCADVMQHGVSRTDVFGCAYSCPVQLATTEGELELDLDAFDAECGSLVYACALFISGDAPVP